MRGWPLLAMLVLGGCDEDVRPMVPRGSHAPVGQDLEQEAKALLLERRTIEAIKRVRERTGMGLKEAKDYVDALERGESPASGAQADSTSFESGDLDDEVRALLSAGRKIEAIKRVRERTGLGLKEAKDYVERFEGR